MLSWFEPRTDDVKDPRHDADEAPLFVAIKLAGFILLAERYVNVRQDGHAKDGICRGVADGMEPLHRCLQSGTGVASGDDSFELRLGAIINFTELQLLGRRHRAHPEWQIVQYIRKFSAFLPLPLRRDTRQRRKKAPRPSRSRGFGVFPSKLASPSSVQPWSPARNS